MNHGYESNWTRTIDGTICGDGLKPLQKRIASMLSGREVSTKILVDVEIDGDALIVWFKDGEDLFMWTEIPWPMLRTAFAIHDAEMQENSGA